MSSLPKKAMGGRKGKAVLPKLFPLPEKRIWLGHCKICNVLSLMWSAIGTSNTLLSL